MMILGMAIPWKFAGAATGAASTVYGIGRAFLLGTTTETYLAAGGGLSLLGLVAWKVLTDRSTEERVAAMYDKELDEERRRVEQLEQWTAEMVRTMAGAGIMPPERPPLPPPKHGNAD